MRIFSTCSSDSTAWCVRTNRDHRQVPIGDSICDPSRETDDPSLIDGYRGALRVFEQHSEVVRGAEPVIEHVIGDNTSITWVLRAGRPEAHMFFSKLGFRSSSDAMERKRK